MASLVLPREVVSLIHHIELNKAGWWNRGVQKLILSVVWLSDGTLAETELGPQLRSVFHVNVDPTKVAEQVKGLVSNGTLVRLADGKLKITELVSRELEQGIQEAEQIETRTRAKFIDLMGRCCPLLNPADEWKPFNEELLLPLVREVGARTYELVSGSALNIEATTRFPKFLGRYPGEQRQGLRTAILSFLDPKDSDVRSYVLRHLNAYFVVEAGNLEAQTIESLAGLTERPPSFKIFVDTNFLFSFLELHENPSNEAAKSLVELTRQLSKKVSCKFYVSPLTMDETKRVIRSSSDLLQGLPVPPNLAEAALEVNLTGVAQKFFEFSKKMARPVQAADYFRPYLSDLIPILRGKGVELFNEPMDSYGTNQEIVDEIVSQLDYERRRFPDKCKTYEQLRHDIILWHVVRIKRPARLESPLEATFWIVTVDYRFLGYDSFKRKHSENQIPVCLHPSALIQMLQFWIPRTPEFEEAVLGSFRWPFLFQDFDPDAERVTSRILGVLARFEDVSRFPTEVITSVLVNEALRQQMAATKDVQTEIELVKTALVEENERVRTELCAKTEETKNLTEEVAAKGAENEALKKQVDEEKARSARLEHQLEEGEASRDEVERRLKEVERRLERQESERKLAVARWTFLVRWAAALVSLLAVSVLAVRLLRPAPGFWRTGLLVWSLILFGWSWFADRSGRKDDRVREWPPVIRLQEFRRWVFGVLALVVAWRALELVGSTFSDWLQGLRGR